MNVSLTPTRAPEHQAVSLRARAWNTGFAEHYIWGYGMGPISFFMDTGMLQAIKARAERT